MGLPNSAYASHAVGVLVSLGIAFSAMATPTTTTQTSESERIFIDEATRSAGVLKILGRLAVQEGDAQSTRDWGAMLATGQDAFLQQLHGAGGKNTSAMHVTPTAYDQHVIDELSTWRSHWFDRRILAAVLEQQRKLLSTLETWSRQSDRRDSDVSRFAARYAEQLRTRINASLTLLSAAGSDPPLPQGPSQLRAFQNDSDVAPTMGPQVLTVKSQDQIP